MNSNKEAGSTFSNAYQTWADIFTSPKARKCVEWCIQKELDLRWIIMNGKSVEIRCNQHYVDGKDIKMRLKCVVNGLLRLVRFSLPVEDRGREDSAILLFITRASCWERNKLWNILTSKLPCLKSAGMAWEFIKQLKSLKLGLQCDLFVEKKLLKRRHIHWAI